MHPGGVDSIAVGYRALAWHTAGSGIRVTVFVDPENWWRGTSERGQLNPWPLCPFCWDDWVFGVGFRDRFKKPDPDVHDAEKLKPVVLRLRRFLQGFWAILAEPYIATSRVRTARPVRRRAAPAHLVHVDDVRVLEFRRPASQATAASGSSVAWSKRWMVRAHWRNQWYPAAGTHRQRYILPYAKGPADKPLDIRATVRALRR